jgi:hypothetical protein
LLVDDPDREEDLHDTYIYHGLLGEGYERKTEMNDI